MINRGESLPSSVISVRLFPELIQKLDTLQQLLGLPSRGDVIRRLIERENFNGYIPGENEEGKK